MSRITFARGAIAILALAALLMCQSVQAPWAQILQPIDPDPSILFVGDIMLDRNVARHAMASSTTALFAGVFDLFKTADARVANLEGAITINPSIAQVDHTILHFTFDPALAQAALAPLNLTAASLANNHTYDFYRGGYESTQSYLVAWGIKPFGHPYNTYSLSTTFDIRGKQFCLVGYHSLYDAGTAEVLAEIARLRPSCYKVIVFAHWGEEYEPVAHMGQTEAAHSFLDAGADLVMGAHPHIVQNIEMYQGRAIFYSLGNFMFDQDFSWATTHGLAVKVTFGMDATTFNLVPITIKNQEASVANEADAARVLSATGRLAEFVLP